MIIRQKGDTKTHQKLGTSLAALE